MRVLHITDFFDANLGYAEYYLARKQIDLGIDVNVITTNQPIQQRHLKKIGFMFEDGIPVIRINAALKLGGTVWIFNPNTLTNLIKNISPDVINCRSLLSPLSQELLLLKTQYDYTLVGDLISGIGTGMLSKVADIYRTQIIKHFLKYWLSNKVDAFFACNKAIEYWMKYSLKLPSYKVFFIPLGADKELFKPNLTERVKNRALLGISSDDVVAIYTGRFLSSKRIHDLLIASKVIINKYHDFKIILIGDGPTSYKERIRLLINRLRINQNIIIVKTVHRKILCNFYNAADFAVWPGAFSISIIEAMACGLPIVIAKSDWTSHYLDYGNGFSFQAGDTNYLSSILFKLVSDYELRKSLGVKSRKLVEDKLNWDIIAKQHMGIYQSCLL